MAARAEKILVAAATVIRGTFMVQLAVTMIASAERTLHHDEFLLISTVMIVESVLMSAYMVARGTYVRSVAIFDICFTAAAILVEPSVVYHRDLVGTGPDQFLIFGQHHSKRHRAAPVGNRARTT